MRSLAVAKQFQWAGWPFFNVAPGSGLGAQPGRLCHFFANQRRRDTPPSTLEGAAFCKRRGGQCVKNLPAKPGLSRVSRLFENVPL
jgi:hypothetical protein